MPGPLRWVTEQNTLLTDPWMHSHFQLMMRKPAYLCSQIILHTLIILTWNGNGHALWKNQYLDRQGQRHEGWLMDGFCSSAALCGTCWLCQQCCLSDIHLWCNWTDSGTDGSTACCIWNVHSRPGRPKYKNQIRTQRKDCEQKTLTMPLYLSGTYQNYTTIQFIVVLSLNHQIYPAQKLAHLLLCSLVSCTEFHLSYREGYNI